MITENLKVNGDHKEEKKESKSRKKYVKNIIINWMLKFMVLQSIERFYFSFVESHSLTHSISVCI